MTPDNQPITVTAHNDERVSSVMLFTATDMIWGEVVTKTSLKVSLWLRSQAIPQFIRLYNASVMQVGMTGAAKPHFHHQLYVPSIMVNAFHLKPPAADPLDYDANEPMRKMEPTTAIIGQFRFDGSFRMSTHTELERFLEVSKEAFASLYDVTITCPVMPNMTPIKVPFTLVRESGVYFAQKSSS
jgi:hypothetical protein